MERSEEKTSRQQPPAESGMLSKDMDVESVLSDAEPWEPVETKLVLYSLLCAAIFLVIGLLVVPTSVFH